jgi:hypothetical protein
VCVVPAHDEPRGVPRVVSVVCALGRRRRPGMRPLPAR